MLSQPTTSLFQKVHLIITILFWLLVIANTAVLIWSYTTMYQYVKLIILIGTDPSSLINLKYNTASLLNYRLELTEFTLDLNAMVTAYWKGPALLPALAIIASTYIYPYFKLIIYFIVYFIPLKPKHQRIAQFLLNQLNKVMFVTFFAVSLQSVTFSFKMIFPTHLLQNITDAHAEAYPGKGLVADIIVIIIYALTDYILLILIKSHTKSRRKPLINHSNYDLEIRTDTMQVQKQYTPTSYLSIFCRSIFLFIIISNVCLLIEAQMTAPLGFELDGVLSNFVPDKYKTNNIFQTGHILLQTSLLNDVTAWFLYVIYIIVFVICPCVVSVLLVIIWIVPMCNKKYGFGVVAKYGLRNLWFIQSWNAFDVFVLCQCGATQSNIKNTTKYLLDSGFPQYCGDSGVVEEMFGEDCSWADAWFTKGLSLYIAAVIIQWMAIFYTSKVFRNKWM